MSLSVILILAVVQGVAEFLPISSSGHLVLVAALLEGGDPRKLDIADINIVLHAGTLVSILVFYWRRVVSLLSEDRRVLGLLIVGTIPLVVVGLPIKRGAAWLLEDPALAGVLLLVTAGILFIVARFPHRDGDYTVLSFGRAFLIGVAQSIAVLPGISRSGTTIAAGLGLGLSRQSAATFSFLLAIPAILGAVVLEIKDMVGGHPISTPIPYLLLGGFVSFAVGYFSLWWLVHWLERGRLIPFAVWCLIAGTIAISLYGLPKPRRRDPDQSIPPPRFATGTTPISPHIPSRLPVLRLNLRRESICLADHRPIQWSSGYGFPTGGELDSTG